MDITWEIPKQGRLKLKGGKEEWQDIKAFNRFAWLIEKNGYLHHINKKYVH